MLNIDLVNKVAMITGVTSGIGAGIARVLASAGCNIAGCGRSENQSGGSRKFLSSVKKEGVNALYQQCDVTSSDEIKNFIQKTIEVFGKIDILISNAGMNVFSYAQDCPEESFDFNHNLNLKSHWLISKECKPYLDRSGNALVVIMSSNHAYSTMPGCFPYNVTKSGLLGLVNAIAVEWGPKIRVIGMAPGYIETEGGEQWFQSFEYPEKEKQKTIALHPLKRLGTPEELGGFCAFLASEYARFITGTTYLVDGGRSALMQDQ